MKIVVLKEEDPKEKRVALTPEGVRKLVAQTHEVVVEEGAGLGCHFTKLHYEDAGATYTKILPKDGDIYLKVTPLNSVDHIREGACVIALLNPHHHKELINTLAQKKIQAFALEWVPRISRAQSMDVLSSQANLAGYRAVLEAAQQYGGVFPMMMTAAGTVKPARVLVLGAGVAGLQAIATAKRLGAVVSAYDVRPVVKEQVESLGARFVDIPHRESGEGQGGYAKEMSDAYQEKQAHVLHEALKSHDIVITTAQIPGKKAPILVTHTMLQTMKPGSVVFDMAIESGGNVEGAKANEHVHINGVTVIAPTHLTSTLAIAASQLFSRNIVAFLNNLLDESGAIREEDEIVRSTRLCKDGVIIHPTLVLKEDV